MSFWIQIHQNNFIYVLPPPWRQLRLPILPCARQWLDKKERKEKKINRKYSMLLVTSSHLYLLPRWLYHCNTPPFSIGLLKSPTSLIGAERKLCISYRKFKITSYFIYFYRFWEKKNVTTLRLCVQFSISSPRLDFQVDGVAC